MSISSAAGRIAAGLLLSSSLVLAIACKPGPPPPPCPATYKELSPTDQNSLFTSCTCAANAGTGGGSVWGSGVYTTDSNICKAAVHAGAVSSTGGSVTVKKSAGCPSYTGTVANGVTTEPWGSFDSSFYFSGYGSGSCGGAGSPSSRPLGSPSGGAPSGRPSPSGAPSATPSARH
jgi:hypothetical protein